MEFLQSFRTLSAVQLVAFVILSLPSPVHGPEENFVEMFRLTLTVVVFCYTIFQFLEESRRNPFSSTIFAKPSMTVFCWLAITGFNSDFSSQTKHKGFLLSV